MIFYTARTIWARLFPPKRLVCQKRLWRQILRELHRRGHGDREAGGFLLGRIEGDRRVVSEFVPYDAIDPHCLRGTILFDGSKMDLVWDICRARNLQVVADVHTHPSNFGQSITDQENPMIPK